MFAMFAHERAAAASLPPCGGGMGRGVLGTAGVIRTPRFPIRTPLPARALRARADLPHKGGGVRSQRAGMRQHDGAKPC